jgi:hypothetical protein
MGNELSSCRGNLNPSRRLATDTKGALQLPYMAAFKFIQVDPVTLKCPVGVQTLRNEAQSLSVKKRLD